MSSTRVLLVRHGQSEWNATGRWQGQADPALSPLGLRQAGMAAERLADAGIEVVCCSPLRRAAVTAEIIAERLALPAPVPVPDLMELDVGEWSGLTHDEIEQRWPGALGPPRRQPPGGEVRSDFEARVRRGLLGVATQHPGLTVAAVAHGGVIRAVEKAAGVPRGPIPNLVAWWLTVDPATATIDAGDRVELAADDDNDPMPLAP